MIHPDTVISPVHPQIGLGLIAVSRIARGTITWALDPLDQVLSPSRMAALPSVCRAGLYRYTWPDSVGNCILSWDLARFVNHSCEPNCLAGPMGFEIAVRDIDTGEELTNDYANLGMMPDEQFVCHCGSSRCRGVISATAATELQDLWAAEFDAALVHVMQVPQPLWELLGKEVQQRIQASISAGFDCTAGALR